MKKQYPISIEIIMLFIAIYTPFFIVPFLLLSYAVYFGFTYLWTHNKIFFDFGNSDNSKSQGV